ncbi:MAG TPA: hypothetical protein VH143_22775 [Kofleriaceae bacterium]|jgi:hypothetical protein|nr:hypothetical protein [Kofleriaceae bacterium]
MSRVAFGDVADELATNDPREVAAAVDTIEAGSAASPELLYAAARACEDKLADPAHALALYRRILRDAPSSAAAVGAARRASELGPLVGDNATAARDFAKLVAAADHLRPDDAIVRGDALAATASWSGAPRAALWLAEWLRRTGRFADAQARYARVIATWPRSEPAREAARDAAGCALDAQQWARAEALASALPADTADARTVRDELVQAARRGRAHSRLDAVAYVAVVLAFALLLASLLEVALRGGWMRPKLAPPVELWFAMPIAGVLVAVAATANRLIAPAVVAISAAGIGVAWLSGTTLALLATRGRPTRLRSVAHLALCAIAVIAAAYIALVKSGLVELLVETVKPGDGLH